MWGWVPDFRWGAFSSTCVEFCYDHCGGDDYNYIMLPLPMEADVLDYNRTAIVCYTTGSEIRPLCETI